MPTLYPQIRTPQVTNAGGLNEHSNILWVQTSGLDTHVNAIMPDVWVYPSTNGMIAVPSSFTAAWYRVFEIRNSKMQRLTYQAVSTTDLNVDANVFWLGVEALGGLTFRMTEDALATPISDDPTNGWPGKPYAPVLVTDGSPLVAPVGNPGGAPAPTMYIDSSAITATPTNASVRILGPAPVLGNPAYNATACSASGCSTARVFLVQAYNPGASQATS